MFEQHADYLVVAGVQRPKRPKDLDLIEEVDPSVLLRLDWQFAVFDAEDPVKYRLSQLSQDVHPVAFRLSDEQLKQLVDYLLLGSRHTITLILWFQRQILG